MFDPIIISVISAVFFLVIAIPLSFVTVHLVCHIFSVPQAKEEKIQRIIAVFYTLGVGMCGFLIILLLAAACLFAGLLLCEEWFLKYGVFIFFGIIGALLIALFLISVKIKD